MTLTEHYLDMVDW